MKLSRTEQQAMDEAKRQLVVDYVRATKLPQDELYGPCELELAHRVRVEMLMQEIS